MAVLLGAVNYLPMDYGRMTKEEVKEFKEQRKIEIKKQIKKLNDAIDYWKSQIRTKSTNREIELAHSIIKESMYLIKEYEKDLKRK